MLAYFDAARVRLTTREQGRFEVAVEAARMGGVFASNLKAYRRWRSRQDRLTRQPQRGLTGQALEAAIMSIQQRFPGNVIRGTMPRHQQGAG